MLVTPRVLAGWAVDAAGADVGAGFAPKKEVVAVLAPDVAGAELPPPIPEKSDEPPAVVVAAVPLPVVVVAVPLVAVAPAGVEAAGAAPNREFPPVDAAGLAAAAPKRLEAAPPKDAGEAALPPELKPAMPDVGCVVAGGAAGVPPKLNEGALLAGVEVC